MKGKYVNKKHTAPKINPIYLGGVVIILILLLLIGGWYVSSLYQKDKKNNLEVSSDQLLLEKAPNIKTLDQEEQKKVIRAITKIGSLEDCQYAEGLVIDGIDYYSVCRDNYLINRAQGGDLSQCNLLSGKSMSVSLCKSEAVQSLHKQGKGSIDMCDSLDSQIDISNCRFRVSLREGIVTKNETHCEAIENEDLRTLCRFQVGLRSFIFEKEDFSCDFLEDNFSNRCESFKELVLENGAGDTRSCALGSNEPFIYDLCREVEEIVYSQ